MLPILLIHGFPFDSSMWQAQAEYLRSAEGGGGGGQGGRTVLTPDLPGFGKTPPQPAPPKEKASIDAYADYIHELIHAAAGGKAIVGGFSMGGYVLLSLLRNYPDDVAAAMFVDTRADADTADARATRLKSIEAFEKDGQAALPPFFETMTGRLLGKRPSADARRRARAIMDNQSPAALIAAQSAMAKRRDQSDLLPDLALPVLIVVGAEDTVTPPSVALAMQSHMPHAMVVQIVAAGHLTPVEQPAAVNGALHAFLATVKE
jgi:pimeloyl-ACP methyl ester carboxylesterase